MQSFIKLTILVVLTFLSYSRQIYDPTTSYVTPITRINFESQITKIRQTTNFVSIVQYYKHNDGFSKKFVQQFDEFTSEYRGVFKIGSCDCDEEAKICEKEHIDKFPTFRVYAPVPIPAVDVEGEITAKNIIQTAARYLHNNAIEITSANINTWVNESPSVPKVLLFTETKGTPMIYKGLSVEFEKKLFFGVVRKAEEALVSRYNINKFPTIIVVKTTEKKPFIYKDEMKFQPIFQFLNVFSEVYVPGGGSSADSAATKSWLTEVVPEMHGKSAPDICIGQEGILCVILFSPNGKPNQKMIDMLKSLHDQYNRKIDRGFDFKYMWLDGSVEKNWATFFGAENEPKLIFLNPSKRKRYVSHEGKLEMNDVKQTFEKVIGGDAKFIKITDQLPEFSVRQSYD